MKHTTLEFIIFVPNNLYEYRATVLHLTKQKIFSLRPCNIDWIYKRGIN